MTAEEPLKDVPLKPVPMVKALVVLAVIVMLVEPLKDVPLIVLAVCRVVAVLALPLKAAVIVPAAKFPEASRATTLEAVLVVVASTANVLAAEPLYAVPVKYVPGVSELPT